MREREVVIVGGGLAGSVLAVALARRGIGSTVLERHAGVPDVLRGELIMPRGARLLEELGLRAALGDACLETEGTVLHHPAFEGGACRVDYDLAPAPLDVEPGTWRPRGLAGWRRPLQEALQGAARATPGVEWTSGFEVARLTRLDDRRLVLAPRDASVEPIAARLVVGADGSSSVVRRLMGFEPVERHERTFVQGFVGRAPRYRERHVHVGVSSVGAAFVFPFPDGHVRSTLEYHQEYRHELDGPRALERHLELLREALPDVWESLGPIEVGTKLQVQPGRTETLASIVEDGLALVGDAAGCLDPFTGFGMAMAIEDATVLARVVAEARGDLSARSLRRYERDRARRLAPRRRATDALAYLFLDKAEGFASPFAARLAERWRDRELVLPLVAAQFAGLDPAVEPSFGLEQHFLGLL